MYDNVKEETKTRCDKTLVEGMFGGWWEEVGRQERGRQGTRRSALQSYSMSDATDNRRAKWGGSRSRASTSI